VIPASILDAILGRRKFSWLPRAEQDRRQITKLASEYRRLTQRRKAK
jgi:hypothetical protein